MAQPTEFYVIQPAFTGGEISEDVASRVDLDKYQLSLLLAENAIIRPYGAVKKRTGTLFCGETKHPDRQARLVRFDFSAEIGYLLEFGDYYLRVWRGGKYLGIEVATPYPAASLAKLRFIQSVDVMYITSGDYPVQKLMRYSEQNWILKAIDWTMPPFLEINDDETAKIQPSGKSGEVTLTATKPVFTTARVGDWLKLDQRIGKAGRNARGYHSDLRRRSPLDGRGRYCYYRRNTRRGSGKSRWRSYPNDLPRHPLKCEPSLFGHPRGKNVEGDQPRHMVGAFRGTGII